MKNRKESKSETQDSTCKLPVKIILIVTSIIIVNNLGGIATKFNDFILNERPPTEIYL